MTKFLALPPTIIDQAIRKDPHLKSAHSRRQYSANLRKFEAWRGDRQMTKLLVETYLTELQEQGLAPSTINQKLASVRWWARKVIDIAYETLPGDQADLISKQAARILTIKVVSGSRPQRGRHLKSSELVALINACHADPSPAGKRDAALFFCAWTTGLRRAELGAIKLQDINPQEETGEGGGITHFAEIKIIGKGDKFRLAYLVEQAYTAVNAWLLVRGDTPGFVFCPIHKSGEPLHERGLSGEALRKIALKRSKASNLKKHLTWHDLRRTLAGNLLTNKNDLVTVQKLLGHASPTTTSRYDRRPEAQRLEAVRSLKMPKIGG